MKRKALSQVKTQIIKRVYFVALIMAICAAVTKGDLVHRGFHPLNDDYDEATIESATSQWMIEVFNSAFPPAWKTTENPHSLPASKKSMSPVPIVINSAPKSGRNHDSHIEFTSSTLAWSIHLCTEQRINNLTLQEMSKSGQPKSGIEAISGNQYHFTTFEPFPHKSGKIVIYDPVLEKCSYLKVGDKIYTFSNAASKKPKATVIEPSIRVNLRVSNQSILPSIMPSQDKRSGSSSSGDPDPWTDYNDHRKPFPYHFLNGKHPAINIAMSWIFKFHPPHIVQEILSSVSTYLAQTLFPQAAEDELNQLREDLQYAAHFAPTISFNQDGSPEIIFIRWNSDGTTKKEIISAHFFIYDEDQEGYDVPIDDFKRLARLFTASHASEDTPVEVFELLLKILTGSVYVKADDETKEETVLLTFNQFKKYIINFDKKKEPHEGQVKSDSQFVGTANEADKPDLQSNEESPVQLSESSISRYTSNLDRLLAGRQNISILGDGQCFFRAIAHYRQQEKHTSKVTRTDVQMIRRQIVDRLKEIVTNGDFREDSHRVIEQTGEDQARTLLRRFSSNISWGEMALIPVASELFQLNIAFVVPDHLGNIQGSIATMEGSTQSVEVEGLNHNIFIYHDGNDHWGISFPLTVPEQEGNTNNQSASQARSDASAHQNQTTSTTIQAHQETIINIPEHTGDDSPPPPSPVESGFQLDDVVLKKEQEDKYGPIAGFEFRLTNEIDEIIQILDSSPVIQKQNAERFVKQLNQYVAELNFLVSNIHQFGEVKRTAELFQEILPSQTRVLKSARRAINNLVNPDFSTTNAIEHLDAIFMLVELQNSLGSYNIPLKLIEQLITFVGSSRLQSPALENRDLIINFIKIVHRSKPTPEMVLSSYLRTIKSQRASPSSFKALVSARREERVRDWQPGAGPSVVSLITDEDKDEEEDDEKQARKDSEPANKTIDLVDSRFTEAYSSMLAEALKSFQRRFVDMGTDNPDNNRDLFEHWLINSFAADAFVGSLYDSPLESTKTGLGGDNGRRYLGLVGIALKGIKKTAAAQITEKLMKFSPQEYADREKAKEKAKSISRRISIHYWNNEYRKLLIPANRVRHSPLSLVKGLTDIILTHETTAFFMVLKKYTHASVHKSLDDFEQQILSTILLSADKDHFEERTSRFISDMMFFNHRMEVLIANYDHSLQKLSPHGSDIYFKFLSLTEGMTQFFKDNLGDPSRSTWMRTPRLLHLEQSVIEMEESFSRNLHTLMNQESGATAAYIMQQLDHLRSLKSIPETHLALFKLLRHYSSVRGKESPKFQPLKRHLVRKHKPVMWIAGQQEKLIRRVQNALSWENQPANWMEDNIILSEMENNPLYSLEIFNRSTLRPVPNFIHNTNARHNQYGVLKEQIPGHDTAFEEGNANTLWNSIRYTMLKNLRSTIEHTSSQQLRDQLGSRHNNVITLINNQMDHVLSHIDTPIDTTEEEPDLFIFVQDLCRATNFTQEDSENSNSDQSTQLCHQLMDSLKAQSQQVKKNMEAIRTGSASIPDKPAEIQIDLPEEMLTLLELVNSGILNSLLRQEVMFQIRTIMPSVSEISNVLALIEFTQGARLHFRIKSNAESTGSDFEKQQLSVTYNLAQRIYSEWMYRIEVSYAERLGEMQREGKPIESDFMDALNHLRQSDAGVLSYITKRIKQAMNIKLREVQQVNLDSTKETVSKSGLWLITESMDRVIQDLKSEKQNSEGIAKQTHMHRSPSQEPPAPASESLLPDESTYSLQEKLETVTILREYFALISRVHHGETLSTKEIKEFWLVRAGRFAEDHGGVSYVMWFTAHMVMTISRYLSELNAVSTAEYPSGGTLPVGSTHFPWAPDLGIDWLSAVMSTWAQGVALLSIAPLLSDNSQTNEMLKACKGIPWALSGASSEFMCHAVQHYLALSAEKPLDSKSTPEQVYYHYASSWDRFNDFLSALSLKYLSPEYNFVGDSWWKKTAAFPLRVLNYATRCFKRSAAIRGGVANNEQYHMCENDKRLIDSLSRMGPQNFIKGYNNVITKSSLQQGTALVMTPWDILNAQNEITSIHENLRSRLDLQSRHEALWNFYHGSELSPFDSQRLADMYGTNAIPVLINDEGSAFSQHDMDIFQTFQRRSCLLYGLGSALQLLGLYAASYDLGTFFAAPIEGAAEMFVNGFCLLAEKNVRQYPGMGQTESSCYWAAVGFLRKSDAWRRILTVFGSKGVFSLGAALITHSHELANGKISISDALKGEGIAAVGKGVLSSLARFLQQYDSFVLLFLGETFDSLDTPWKEITSGTGVRKEPKVTPDLISASRTDVKRVAAQSRGSLEKFQTLLEAIINERNSVSFTVLKLAQEFRELASQDCLKVSCEGMRQKMQPGARHNQHEKTSFSDFKKNLEEHLDKVLPTMKATTFALEVPTEELSDYNHVKQVLDDFMERARLGEPAITAMSEAYMAIKDTPIRLLDFYIHELLTPEVALRLPETLETNDKSNLLTEEQFSEAVRVRYLRFIELNQLQNTVRQEAIRRLNPLPEPMQVSPEN